MVKLGNFLFHYRNLLFPLFYVLLFIPSPVIFSDYRIAVIIGLLIALTGQIIRMLTIGLVYIIRGGRDRRIYAEGLVTTGIFSHCRNPLYVGNILVILGLSFVANSLVYLLVFVPLFLFFYQAIVLAEENFLRNKFGESYDQYTHDVNRWAPKLRGLTATLSSMQFKWKRVAIKEYNSTYVWMTGAVLLIMKHHWYQNDLLFRHSLPVYILLLVLLLTAYLFVRFMKKTGRWKGD